MPAEAYLASLKIRPFNETARCSALRDVHHPGARVTDPHFGLRAPGGVMSDIRGKRAGRPVCWKFQRLQI